MVWANGFAGIQCRAKATAQRVAGRFELNTDRGHCSCAHLSGQQSAVSGGKIVKVFSGARGARRRAHLKSATSAEVDGSFRISGVSKARVFVVIITGMLRKRLKRQRPASSSRVNNVAELVAEDRSGPPDAPGA